MTEVRVVYQYLVNLAQRTRGVGTELRQVSCLGVSSLRSSPEISKAYQDFSGRWDERRADLADTLDTIADNLEFTCAEFQNIEAELSDALGTPHEV